MPSQKLQKNMLIERIGNATIEGDSPVHESIVHFCNLYPSTAGHVKPCRNLGGPSSKAKYYLVTDSELVPWGKGEKNPCEGSEKTPREGS